MKVLPPNYSLWNRFRVRAGEWLEQRTLSSRALFKWSIAHADEDRALAEGQRRAHLAAWRAWRCVALRAFGRCPEHVELMRWVFRPGNARGGFIRFYAVQPDGFSSGEWRAEPGHELRAIDRFTPIHGEKEGPPVNP